MNRGKFLFIALTFFVIICLASVSAHWYCPSFDSAIGPVDYQQRAVANYSVSYNSTTGNVSLEIEGRICKGKRISTWSNLWSTNWLFGNRDEICTYDFTTGQCGIGGYGNRRCCYHLNPLKNIWPSGYRLMPGSNNVRVSSISDSRCADTGVMWVINRTISMSLSNYNEIAGNGKGFVMGIMSLYDDGNYKSFPSEFISLPSVPVPECEDGETQPCQTGEQGVCSEGTQTCTEGGWGECVRNVEPSDEVCDGLDNDCDGLVDEGNPGGGGSCDTGLQGICQQGTLACTSGSLVCMQNNQPSPEVCNQLDDDCNDLIDDGINCNITCYENEDCGEDGWLGLPVCNEDDIWQIYRTYSCNNPGTVGSYCSHNDELLFKQDCGEDYWGDWGEYYCKNGDVYHNRTFYDYYCECGSCHQRLNVTEEFQDCLYGCEQGDCLPPPQECTDNDEDGYAIEGGDCGPVDCDDDNPEIHPGAEEVCNSIDDDCDQEIDETFDVGDICYAGVGECRNSGEKICSEDGLGTECNAIPGEPEEEICDQLDNDCDGLIDENLTCGEIRCNRDRDCGLGGCAGGPNYCCNGDVCQLFISFTCHNPGTTESYCTNTTFPLVLTDCEFGCEDGFCVPEQDEECEDTCESLGKECGWQMICAEEINCGSCGEGYECQFDVCVEEEEPQECESNEECNDGLYCNGQETCINGTCHAGTIIDCSANNLLGIATCNNNPDNNPKTWDYFAGFISSCNEQADSCTTSTINLTHNYIIGECGVECLSDEDCGNEECENYGCTEEDEENGNGGGHGHSQVIVLNYCGNGICDVEEGEGEFNCEEDCRVFRMISYTVNATEETMQLQGKVEEKENILLPIILAILIFLLLILILIALLRR